MTLGLGPLAVLLPVKSFADAKLRLAPALDASARRDLARSMASHVVACAGTLPVAVVCDDTEVAAWARDSGALVVWEPERGLNRAVEAGVASAADIDKAIKVGLGYKMGPLELIDLIGLDTQIRLCEAFYPVTLDPRAATPPLLRRMVAAGLLGRKSGRGFYDYQGNAMFGA